MTTPHNILLSRRRILQGGLAALATWCVAGLLKPLRAVAAEWSKSAFESRKLDDALQHLFGATDATPSASIRITAPYQAENGATVRFEVSTDLPNVSTIAVLVEKNERPLVMAMTFSGAQPFVSLRMKMAQSSDVHAVVKSQGKLYSAKQNIKVTVGGCGG
jgi:sulfur-oxidizing protein SoxY